MNPILLDWIGYIASLIVLISLLMSSIKRLRWINLVGALIFGIYGFLIGSIPTGVMNVGIVVIDIYFLAKIYLSKDYFTILPIDEDSEYLKSFIEFYRSEIETLVPVDTIDPEGADVKLYVLRNMTPAAVFIGHKLEEGTLEIRLDYAIPQYRDFKLGSFIFDQQKDYFMDRGYTKFVTYGTHKNHVPYLQKMGFKEVVIDGTTRFEKTI
jgi:hypothetical protein